MDSSKRSSSSSSLSSLHSELLEEILCRVPAEAMMRSKPTCKQWNDLIKALPTNKTFIYKHLDRSSSDSSSKRFIRTSDSSVRIIDPVTKERSTSPMPAEFQESNKVHTILQCDGLVLCIRRDYSQISQPRRPHIAIWNPLLRRAKWIDPSGGLLPNSVYGMGYKTREEDGYKILRFSNSWFKVAEGDTQVEVYEFKNSSWRTLDHVKVDVRVDSKGVSVMGNMYWLTEKNGILGFDFTAETFKDVCSCPPLFFGHRRYLSCFREDRLSLLQQAKESKKIEVWISNNLADESVSFTRYFSVDKPGLPALNLHESILHPVYCFVKPRRMFALCEGDEGEGVTYTTYGILCEIDEGGLRNQTETETETERIYGRLRYPIFCGHVYVPSFVPLP